MKPLTFEQLETIFTGQFDSAIESLQTSIERALSGAEAPSYVTSTKAVLDNSLHGFSQLITKFFGDNYLDFEEWRTLIHKIDDTRQQLRQLGIDYWDKRIQQILEKDHA